MKSVPHGEEIFTPNHRTGVFGLGPLAAQVVGELSSLPLSVGQFIAIDTDATALENLLRRYPHLRGIRIPAEVKLRKDVRSRSDVETKLERRLPTAIERLRTEGRLPETEVNYVLADMAGSMEQWVAPILARVSKRAGALTLAMVLPPSQADDRFPGTNESLDLLMAEADATIVVPREFARMSPFSDEPPASCEDANRQTLSYLQESLLGCIGAGLICFDFSDLEALLARGGPVSVVTAKAQGDPGAERVEQLVQGLRTSPWFTPECRERTHAYVGTLAYISRQNREVIQEYHLLYEAVQSLFPSSEDNERGPVGLIQYLYGDDEEPKELCLTLFLSPEPMETPCPTRRRRNR